MTVIHLQRTVCIACLECGDLLAAEMSTHGLNKPNETFDQYCERMNYHEARLEPRYPLPAIPLQVAFPWEDYSYEGMIYINALNYGEDDPILVCCWDFYEYDIWYGKYQACYCDKQAAWYKLHGAWGK